MSKVNAIILFATLLGIAFCDTTVHNEATKITAGVTGTQPTIITTVPTLTTAQSHKPTQTVPNETTKSTVAGTTSRSTETKTTPSLTTQTPTSQTSTTPSPTPIPTTPKPQNKIQLTFTSKFTRVNHPFLVSCNIGGTYVDHQNKNFSVVFYKTADTDKHEVARFEALAPNSHHPTQRIIFSDTAHRIRLGELTLTPEVAAYPNFTLLVTPRGLFKAENYWCQLEEPDQSTLNQSTVLATSNLWVNIPIVSLSIEKVNGTTNEHLARCRVEHFDLVDSRSGATINSSTVSYEVIFYVDEENVKMASFEVSKGRMEVFRPYILSSDIGRTVLGHGPSVEYPVFEVLYKNEAFHNRALANWCRLVYSGLTPGSQGGYASSNTVFSI